MPLTSHSNKIKAQLGIVPQEIALYEDISAYHNVAFFASLYGVKKKDLPKQVMNALTFVGLSDKKNDDPRTFSGGMKRRLNIACAIAHNPKLLIIDEPTVGIDPQSRNIFILIKGVKRKRYNYYLYNPLYWKKLKKSLIESLLWIEALKSPKEH